MNHKYKFYDGAFNNFSDCAMEILERDIERSQLSLMGKTMFRNVREERAHRGCVDRLEVLKLIVQLRKGEIELEAFHEIVKITK
jgi:hypothetical protein